MPKNFSVVHSFLNYTKSQRIGLLLLFTIIVLLQLFYRYGNYTTPEIVNPQAASWLANQKIIDSLKSVKQKYQPTSYPFNPNFITDFKGYKLGMSVEEIDRLLAFRKQNKYVNTAEEFQQVTQVSDSLLKAISPYFKFPDWVKNKKVTHTAFVKTDYSKPEKLKVKDINQATKEDLMKIYGIGDKLSDRILLQKEKLGAFVSMEQMDAIWGLSPEVIQNLNTHFDIQPGYQTKKISINSASVKELAQFPFFNYSLAKEIVTYRTMQGDLKIEDLTKIKGFPVEKIKIIALYLEF